jgi:hypothetical protein
MIKYKQGYHGMVIRRGNWSKDMFLGESIEPHDQVVLM